MAGAKEVEGMNPLSIPTAGTSASEHEPSRDMLIVAVSVSDVHPTRLIVAPLFAYFLEALRKQ